MKTPLNVGFLQTLVKNDSLVPVSFFTFNNKFYIQVAIRALLGPILANIFLSPHEENWLNKCPIEFKPVFIEGMLMIFLHFLNHLNLPNRIASICPLNTRT